MTLSATRLAAENDEKYLGRYEATGEENEGAPVYENSHGQYLSRWSDGTWHTGLQGSIGVQVMKSVGTAECPASNSQWQYYVNGGWRSSDITAECNGHT